jgi:hypothetical protein
MDAAKTVDSLASKIIPIVLGIIGIAGISIAIYFIVKAVKKKKENDKLVNSNADNGNGVTVDLGMKAAEIHEALHGGYFSEDEVTAMNVIKGLSTANVLSLENLYFSLYGKNLKSDLIKYLSASQWTEIKHKFI